MRWPLSLLINYLDEIVKKDPNIWILPVYFIGTGKLGDNMLAVYEYVKNDHSIKKIILIKKDTDIDSISKSNSTLVIKINSIRAIYYILKAKFIFIQHSIWLDLSKALYQINNFESRIIINLWHGMPIKDISHAATGIINERSLIEMLSYKMPVSSAIYKLNMRKAFYKVKKDDFWITGVPRYDFMLKDILDMPKTYQNQLSKLDNILNGANLVLYAPTYRETDLGGVYYEFSENEIKRIKQSLKNTNSKLGLRYHPYRQPNFIKELVDNNLIIDLSTEIVSDIGLLVREAKLVVTDYSSIILDCLFINTKMVCFAYDLEHYNSTQRGFFFNFEDVVPTVISKEFETLLKHIEDVNVGLNKNDLENYNKISEQFFQYKDANNTKRVIERVKLLK